MDRSAINQALAKVLAYIQCGKLREAEYWQNQLNMLLNSAKGRGMR